MKKIIISYWHIKKFDDLEYSNGTEYEYTKEKADEVIDDILGKGYNVMLQATGPIFRIYISRNFFGKERIGVLKKKLNGSSHKHSDKCGCDGHK